MNIDGVTGYTSDVGDVHDMAENALHLLKDPVLHKEFSDNALKQANKFSLTNIGPEYLELYSSAIKSATEV